jgi:hypothetical protein
MRLNFAPFGSAVDLRLYFDYRKAFDDLLELSSPVHRTLPCRGEIRVPSGCFKDPEAFELFENLEPRPAIEIMQNKQAVEVAINLLVNSIEGF